MNGENKPEWYIKIIDQPDDLYDVERLQQRVWYGNDIEVVPAHIMLAIVRHGGMVIGAYLKATHELIGFVLGFPGYIDKDKSRQEIFLSHQMGVVPKYRHLGVGYALKRAQWQMARKMGYALITWTYDPLLSRNAYLNIHKLGAICRMYHVNYYGELRDGLNAGIPTDRFEVEWWVHSRRVIRRLSKIVRKELDLAHCLAAGGKIVNQTMMENGVIKPIGYQEDLLTANTKQKFPILLVEIPSDFLALKEVSLDLANLWRSHTKEIFTHLFGTGYIATDVIRIKGNLPRTYYVLTDGDTTL